MKSNKGGVSVLLCAVFVVVVLAVGVAADAGSLAVARSYAERINYLACKSVLAEYDYNLFADYGLIGVEGGNGEIGERAGNYINLMKRVNEKSGDELVFFDLELVKMEADCSGYRLTNDDIFMKQIKDQIKYSTVSLILDGIRTADACEYGINREDEWSFANNTFILAGAGDVVLGNDGGGENTPTETEREPIRLENNRDFNLDGGSSQRILRSKRVISSLPSKGKDGYGNVSGFGMKDEDDLEALESESTEFFNQVKSMAGAGGDKLILIEYIKRNFKNTVNCREEWKETFFENETEYIISGNMSDSKNYQSVKRQLFLIRTALNIAHIYSDADKNRITLETAALLFPEIPAVITQAIIITAWAGAEANEDIITLYSGGSVPLIKGKDDWKLSIDSIMSGGSVVSDEYQGEKGFNYGDYIQILLLMKSNDVLISRTMDLIQINMKGRYDVDFDLRNYVVGFKGVTQFERKAYLPEVLPGIIEDNSMSIEGIFEY